MIFRLNLNLKRTILFSFALFFLNILSGQTDLTSEVMHIQDTKVSLRHLDATLKDYKANPQDYSLSILYNHQIIDAIVDDELYKVVEMDAYIREYFTTPDNDERKIYEEVLLQAIEEL